MCPKEIQGRLIAFSASIKRGLEGYDDLAFMVGSYVAHSFHDPKKYPKKPCMVKRDIRIVPEQDDVKGTLMAFVETHNEVVKNGGNA